MKIIKRIINIIKHGPRVIQAAFLSRKVLIPFDEHWFKGKRVAIIGGADSALKEKSGSYIDGFDVVVRINKGVEVVEAQKEYIGTKTDVLFHCFYVRENDSGSSPVTLDLWKKHQVGKLIFSHNYRCSAYSLLNFLYFIKLTKGLYRFAQVPGKLFFANVRATKPYAPTTGFIAINTVFSCRPKELYITGVTFFKSPHNQAYRKGTPENYQKMFEVQQSHDPEIEYQHVKSLYEKHPDIIKPDKVLEQIFLTN